MKISAPVKLTANYLAILTVSLTLSACSGSGDDDDDVTNGNDTLGTVDLGTVDTSDTNIDGDGTDNNNATATHNNSTAIPSDCGIITLPNNGQVCVSASEGNTLYSLTETGDVDFSAMLPDDAVLANTRVFSGSNLYVLNPTRENQGNWGVTAIDAGGNVQYTTVLSGNIASVETGFSIAPHFFLHVVDAAGESRIVQLDESTGAVGKTLNLAGQNIERVGSESFDGATFVSILSSGETTYRDSERLEPYQRGFTFSPESFEREFANLMNLTRANYLAQFIDVFNQTNAFADSTSANTTLPCAVGGTVEVLPQSSFFFTNDITRAYRYDNCILNDRTINGTIIYSSQTTPPAVNDDNTLIAESIEFNEVSITQLIDSQEQPGIVSNRASTVSARINNSLDIAGSGSTVETNKDVSTTVSSYVQSSAGVELVSISDANYQAKSYQLLHANPSSGAANLRESGSMTLVLSPELNISLNITEPLYYEISGAESQQPVISQAPESGLARVRSSDGSTLDVNATLSGVNMQNYLLVQAGNQTSVDGIWNIAPVSITRSLINLP